MKKIIFVLLCSLYVTVAGSQQVSNVNFTEIKQKLEADKDLYKSLQKRFTKTDTTLTAEDFQVLYYGQCFQKNYQPYGKDYDNIEKFKKYFLKSDYANALPVALTMIGNNPMDMEMTFKALVCYYELKDEEGKAAMAFRYNNIMGAVYESGDGKTESTAFVVMRISDEYELMANMEVEMTSQALRGMCDVMTLKKNDLGVDKLFFNVSKLFESMMKK